MVSFIKFKSGRKEFIDVSYPNQDEPFNIVVHTKSGWYRRTIENGDVRYDMISFGHDPRACKPLWTATDTIDHIAIDADHFMYQFNIRVDGVNIIGTVYLPGPDARYSEIVKIAMDAVEGSTEELVEWYIDL